MPRRRQMAIPQYVMPQPDMTDLDSNALAAFAQQMQGTEEQMDTAMSRSSRIRQLQMDLLQQFLTGNQRDLSLLLQQQRLANQ